MNNNSNKTFTYTYEQFVDAMKLRKEEKKLTTQEICEKTHLSPYKVKKFFLKDENINLGDVYAIVGVLGVSFTIHFEEIDDKDPEGVESED